MLEPKLTTPCTSQEPSEFWQFRGPPESPWRIRERNVHEAATQALRTFVKYKEKWLTLQLASWPSPPAQTMLLVTRLPHQSYLLQVSWPTTGRRACCRTSAIGPPAWEKRTHLVPTGHARPQILSPFISGTYSRDGPIRSRSRENCVAGSCQMKEDRQA